MPQEELDFDHLLGGKVAFQLGWEKIPTTVNVRIMNMDAYGAGKTLETKDYVIDLAVVGIV
jgi:hypothetical protein